MRDGGVPHRLSLARVTSGRMGSDDSWGLCGLFQIGGPCGASLRIIASTAEYPESQGWEHVSVSIEHRTPNWREMCFVKDLFWSEDETVIQFHPPKAEYVNNHPYCLHLWKNTLAETPTPPSILVGIKGLEIPA